MFGQNLGGQTNSIKEFFAWPIPVNCYMNDQNFAFYLKKPEKPLMRNIYVTG